MLLGSLFTIQKLKCDPVLTDKITLVSEFKSTKISIKLGLWLSKEIISC
jgi:hypothetical protein